MLSKVVSTGGMSNLPQRTLNVPTTWRHIRFKAIFKYLSDSCFVLFISSDFCLKRKRYSGRAAAALERRFRKIYGVSSSWRRDCVEKHTYLQRMHHNATEVKRNSLMVFVRWFYLKKKKKISSLFFLQGRIRKHPVCAMVSVWVSFELLRVSICSMFLKK